MPGGVGRPSWRVGKGREAFLEGREGQAGSGSPAGGLGLVRRPSHMAVRGQERSEVPPSGPGEVGRISQSWEVLLESREG